MSTTTQSVTICLSQTIFGWSKKMPFRNILIDENDSMLNFCISDTPLQKPVRSVLKFGPGVMSKAEFYYQANKLYQCCLKPVRDMHKLHKNRIMGIKIIDHIVLRADSSYITVPHVMRITWSIMSCIHHFQLRLRTGTTGLVHYSRKRTTEKCVKSYSKLIRLFEPSMHRIILNAIMVFYKEGKLWEFEFACTDLIVDLMSIYLNFEEAMGDILNIIEAVGIVDISEARHLMQVMYEVFEKVPSPTLSDKLVERLLSMLESSIVPKDTDRLNYVPLRRPIELCIRNMISNLCNKGLLVIMKTFLRRMNIVKHEEGTLDHFGSIVAFAARRYRPKNFLNNIATKEIFLGINALTTSGHSISISASSRIWHGLLDRNNNLQKFSTPKIYLQDCDYKIKIKQCPRNDKLLFKEWRHIVYDTIMISIKESVTRIHLEEIFQTMALALTEIPCGYTAATYIATVLCIQEYAFRLSSDDLVKSHHLHAIVLSIMSLACYIHKAEVLYEYVNSIMERRAEWAPHLNPPLKVEYEYAQHHILWNRPDLFFEDWETRYGLWKCFRVKTTKEY